MVEGYKLISLLKFYKKKNIEVEILVNLKEGLLLRGNIVKLRRIFRRYLILQDKNNILIKVFLDDIIPSSVIPIGFIPESKKNNKNKKERNNISSKLRFEVFRRDKFVCQYCGACGPNVELEIDHIIPVSRGGTDDKDNLKTACFDCNRGKGDKV